MIRGLTTLACLLFAAGCGQQDPPSGKNSAAPAYVAPTSVPDAETAPDQETVPDERDTAVASSAARASDITASDEASDETPLETGADRNQNEPAGESASASADDTPGSAERSPVRKGSAAKLVRGLTNSVRRAMNKAYADRGNASPPPEDDPFPNGEPADADPDTSR